MHAASVVAFSHCVPTPVQNVATHTHEATSAADVKHAWCGPHVAVGTHAVQPPTTAQVLTPEPLHSVSPSLHVLTHASAAPSPGEDESPTSLASAASEPASVAGTPTSLPPSTAPSTNPCVTSAPESSTGDIASMPLSDAWNASSSTPKIWSHPASASTAAKAKAKTRTKRRPACAIRIALQERCHPCGVRRSAGVPPLSTSTTAR